MMSHIRNKEEKRKKKKKAPTSGKEGARVTPMAMMYNSTRYFLYSLFSSTDCYVDHLHVK
jgi:hypothetical protein